MSLWLLALPGFQIISGVSGIVNVMCLVVRATACLHILDSGSHFNRPVGFMKSRIENVKSQYQYAYWNVPTQELMEFGAIFLTCCITGIFEL